MKKSFACLTIIALFLASCGTNSDSGHGHPHDDNGLEGLAYTLYSDKSEIFVEFKPLIVGIPSKFAAHFTVLGENFTALSEGTVTVSLIVADKGIKHSADAPTTPGIYRLALTPTTAGTGKLIFDIQTKLFTDKITIENVKVYTDEKSALADQKEESGGNDITYLKEQAWKVEFANAPVRKQVFSNIIKSSGQILAAPGDEIMVTAKASGIVLFSGNKTIIGSDLSEGTPLFTIAGGDLAEGNIDVNYRDSKADYERSKADYERAKELVKDQIVSEKDFLHAKTEFEKAQATFKAIEKNYSSSGQKVLAAMSGFVKNILVTEGQYVTAGTPLATISKNKKLILQVDVSQKHFEKLPSIRSANFKTTVNEKVLSTQELNGKVISYGKSASSDSPFIPITFEIDNVGNLIPGSVAEVYLKSSPVPDAFVIPVSSLIEEQGVFFVYVQMAGESFQKREVKLGASDGLDVQLLSGVAEGERVVVKGAYQIKLSQASGTMPAHGHEH